MENSKICISKDSMYDVMYELLIKMYSEMEAGFSAEDVVKNMSGNFLRFLTADGRAEIENNIKIINTKVVN